MAFWKNFFTFFFGIPLALHYLCHRIAKIGVGSEKQKNCVFILLFARLALSLPLYSEDRRRLGNANKKLRILFGIPLALHYLCKM